MKKVAALLLFVCFLAGFAACGGEIAEQEKSENPVIGQTTQPEIRNTAADVNEESRAVSEPSEEDASEPAVPANSSEDDGKLFDRFFARFDVSCIVDIDDFNSFKHQAGEKAFMNWMLDNPIDKCIDEYWKNATTTGDMRNVATVELENWLREVDETLNELESLLPEELYSQLADMTERRIKAEKEAVEFSHSFRAWIWGWAGTLYGPLSISFKTDRVRSVCAELKIYEIRAFYIEKYEDPKDNGVFPNNGYRIPEDISEFTEKYPITFENTLGDFLD